MKRLAKLQTSLHIITITAVVDERTRKVANFAAHRGKFHTLILKWQHP